MAYQPRSYTRSRRVPFTFIWPIVLLLSVGSYFWMVNLNTASESSNTEDVSVLEEEEILPFNNRQRIYEEWHDTEVVPYFKAYYALSPEHDRVVGYLYDESASADKIRREASMLKHKYENLRKDIPGFEEVQRFPEKEKHQIYFINNMIGNTFSSASFSLDRLVEYVDRNGVKAPKTLGEGFLLDSTLSFNYGAFKANIDEMNVLYGVKKREYY